MTIDEHNERLQFPKSMESACSSLRHGHLNCCDSDHGIVYDLQQYSKTCGRVCRTSGRYFHLIDNNSESRLFTNSSHQHFHSSFATCHSKSEQMDVSTSTHSGESAHIPSLTTTPKSTFRIHTSKSTLRSLLVFISIVIIFTFSNAVIRCSYACSARSTPKPRPYQFSVSSRDTFRSNVSFQTYACPPAYASWYCMNGSACFTLKVSGNIHYNCECLKGYIGRRCELKESENHGLHPLFDQLTHIKESRFGQVTMGVLFIICSAALAGVAYIKKPPPSPLSLESDVGRLSVKERVNENEDGSSMGSINEFSMEEEDSNSNISSMRYNNNSMRRVGTDDVYYHQQQKNAHQTTRQQIMIEDGEVEYRNMHTTFATHLPTPFIIDCGASSYASQTTASNPVTTDRNSDKTSLFIPPQTQRKLDYTFDEFNDSGFSSDSPPTTPLEKKRTDYDAMYGNNTSTFTRVADKVLTLPQRRPSNDSRPVFSIESCHLSLSSSTSPSSPFIPMSASTPNFASSPSDSQPSKTRFDFIPCFTEQAQQLHMNAC